MSVLTDIQSNFDALRARVMPTLAAIPDGHPTGDVLLGIEFDAYGTPQPVLDLAQVTLSGKNAIGVHPFDPSLTQAMADAIREARPELTVGDNNPIGVVFPAFTPERELVVRDRIAEACDALHGEVSQLVAWSKDQIDLAGKQGPMPAGWVTRGRDEVEKLAESARVKIEEARQSKEKRLGW